MQTIIRFLKRIFYYQKFKFEDKPEAEFIITHHGKTRMIERFKCSPGKMEKIVTKAWKYGSNFYIPKRILEQHATKYPIVGKYYMGHAFVFANKSVKARDITQKILITVYKFANKKGV